MRPSSQEVSWERRGVDCEGVAAEPPDATGTRGARKGASDGERSGGEREIGEGPHQTRHKLWSAVGPWAKAAAPAA